MPKNIVILMDGTSNEISANRTNILRLYGTLAKSDQQLVYYDPGVGTFGAENVWLRFWRKTVEIWGLATGWGLDQNVKEAYRFLVENYDRGNGDADGGAGRDRIYIFGFSRGAYSARVLAGFIHAVGLIEKRNLNLLDYAYRAYKNIGENEQDKFGLVRLYERVLNPDHPPVRLLGLFDTVASVIEAGRFGPRLRTHAFSRRNRSVESVRHAVAIDERRTMFRAQLWAQGGEYWRNLFDRNTAQPQDFREVWFSGVHGDVGGGYPEAESRLAKLPLHWMIGQTGPMGLIYQMPTVNELVLGQNPEKHYVGPDPLAEQHDSMNLVWRILEFVPQWRRADPEMQEPGGFTLPRSAYRKIPSGATVHNSVQKRIKVMTRPPNLPEDYQVEEA